MVNCLMTIWSASLKEPFLFLMLKAVSNDFFRSLIVIFKSVLTVL